MADDSACIAKDMKGLSIPRIDLPRENIKVIQVSGASSNSFSEFHSPRTHGNCPSAKLTSFASRCRLMTGTRHD
jgi:hypothetical protein